MILLSELRANVPISSPQAPFPRKPGPRKFSPRAALKRVTRCCAKSLTTCARNLYSTKVAFLDQFKVDYTGLAGSIIMIPTGPLAVAFMDWFKI
jgi:hypothetical protein